MNARLRRALLPSLFVSKAILVSQFLRARAWWRLDSAGVSAGCAARNVVSLLDAAAYLHDLPDDDPAIAALEAAGCFANSVFDPGPEGWIIIREWQLDDEVSAGPADLLAQLVQAAGRDGPRRHLAGLALPLAGLALPLAGLALPLAALPLAGLPLAAEISIPHQPGPADDYGTRAAPPMTAS
jgi:hypothetical protein